MRSADSADRVRESCDIEQDRSAARATVGRSNRRHPYAQPRVSDISGRPLISRQACVFRVVIHPCVFGQVNVTGKEPRCCVVGGYLCACQSCSIPRGPACKIKHHTKSFNTLTTHPITHTAWVHSFIRGASPLLHQSSHRF
jgi:hypothetical protein